MGGGYVLIEAIFPRAMPHWSLGGELFDTSFRGRTGSVEHVPFRSGRKREMGGERKAEDKKSTLYIKQMRY